MKIIHIASEFSPIAKIGGLADVLLGLCRELQATGHVIEVIIPKYKPLNLNEIDNLKVIHQDMLSYSNKGRKNNTIWSGKCAGINLYFIQDHHPNQFFDRDEIYGYKDDISRFLYFTRASMDFIFKTQRNPDIIHLHEWHTAIAAPLYHEIFKSQCSTPIRIIFTMHNLEYQGRCCPKEVTNIGLVGKKFLTADLMQDPKCHSMLNLLKGGIVFSDYFTTVSPRYAEEIKTKEYGAKLDVTIRTHSDRFKGILNGIDYTFWNPKIDPALTSHYGLNDKGSSIEYFDHKKLNKDFIRKTFKMPLVGMPLVICISRLVPQKGIKLIKHTIQHVLKHEGQMILFGSSPIPRIQNEFQELAEDLKDNSNIVFIFESQNEKLAHQLYAAGDMLIVPSLYEPCGLTQIIALQYGTVPIVRRTGGLADTIIDVDEEASGENPGNGFSFDLPIKKAISQTINRAFKCWKENPKEWKQLMLRGMKEDFSWKQSAQEYLKIYTKPLIFNTNLKSKKSLNQSIHHSF